MPRRRVDFRPGEFYHVYHRGNARQQVYFERENYFYFLRRIRLYLRPACEIAAYCLMPNHFHLLVRLAASDFSKAMQSLGQSYTNAINKRLERSGALFEGPFQAKHISEESYLLHLSRYIHLNPVAGGLVDSPERWDFSSYRDYIGLRKGTLPRPELVLRGIRSPQDYREFVQKGLGLRDTMIEHLILEGGP